MPVLSRIISILLAVLLVLPLAPAVLISDLAYRDGYEKTQLRHLEQLQERYADPGFVPAAEGDFTAFDLEAALESGVKFNEVQFLATHNSYKLPLKPAARLALNYVGLPFGLIQSKDEYHYGFETLTAQLDRGIRSLELDVMRDGGMFRTGHIAALDMNSTCPDFQLACREIRMWSQANPGHLPITLLLETRSATLADGAIHRPVDAQVLPQLEAVVAQEFGGMLCTPGDVLGEHESFAALRRDDAWPPLRDLLGKILVIHHYRAGTTEDYVALDPSMRTQKIFPSLWYPAVEEVITDYASFIVCNEPMDHGDALAAFTAANLLVRTRLDVYSFPERGKSYAMGVDSGALLLSTDYPPRSDDGEDRYTAHLEGGFTVKLR